jgi:hypothetical protein
MKKGKSAPTCLPGREGCITLPTRNDVFPRRWWCPNELAMMRNTTAGGTMPFVLASHPGALMIPLTHTLTHTPTFSAPLSSLFANVAGVPASVHHGAKRHFEILSTFRNLLLAITFWRQSYVSDSRVLRHRTDASRSLKPKNGSSWDPRMYTQTHTHAHVLFRRNNRFRPRSSFSRYYSFVV